MESIESDQEIRVKPLQKETLQDRVHAQLSDLILDGGISPGQLVTIQGLAKAFGVSTMPVREALKRLTTANALTIVSGRSVGIPPLTLEKLTDLRDVRLVLEGTAVSWAARKADAALVEQLQLHVDRMDQATRNGDTKEYLRANRLFHFAIYRAGKSPTLDNLIEIVWLQISPYFNLLRESGNYTSSNERHRAIMEALGKGDANSAREGIVGDIEDSYAVLSEVLSGNA